MISVQMSIVGLALITISLVAQRSEAQMEIQTCDDLISSIEGGDMSFELLSDITCTETITIKSDMDISIDGGSKTLAIGESFVSSNASVFYNQGTLEVTNLTITPASDIAVRGILNEGELIVRSCTFESLNIESDLLDDGGAIYSNAEGVSVVIENSSFYSNAAGVKGGAICAVGTEVVEVYNSEFLYNEAGINDNGGSGGDIYAADGVTLKVRSSKFVDSSSSYGGGAIECCGATITDCSFTGAESGSESSEHYGGALLVGRPDYGECQHALSVNNVTFSSCVVPPSSGAGGSIAVFDTSTTIKDSLFDGSQGTAVLFQSSNMSGSHQINMESTAFYSNSLPAVQYASDSVSQGTAFVLENTAAEEGENVSMGTFDDIFCYSNDPYECEFLYEGVDITFDGDFKCQICNFDSERLYVGVETNLTSDGESRSSSSGSSSSASSSSGPSSSEPSSSDDVLIIGLVAGLAASLILFTCAACALVWSCVKHRTATRGSPNTATAETGTQPSAPVASARQDPNAAQEFTAAA